MEYPFKDLLPLDEVLEREGYYKDWTHLDPKVFYSLTQISEYIKTKGFGVDVRLLIAQLAEHFGLKTAQINEIELFFKDVMQELAEDKDFYSLPEIAGARGGFDTLRERLAQTVSKGNVNINDFDEETRKTFLEAQGIDVNYVLGENSVGVENTKFIYPSPGNLYNYKTNKPGFRFDTDGKEFADEEYTASDFIPVQPGSYIVATPNEQDGQFRIERIPVYDENYNFLKIGRSATLNQRGGVTVDVPGFVRISPPIDKEKTFVFARQEYYQGYTEYKLTQDIASEVKDFSVENNSIKDGTIGKEKTNFIVRGKNLFDPENVLLDKFGATSTPSDLAGYYTTTEPIFLEAGKHVTINKVREYAVHTYSGYRLVIENTQNNSATVTLGPYSDEVFLHVSGHLSNLHTTQIEYGTEVTDFEEYGWTISGVKIPVELVDAPETTSTNDLVVEKNGAYFTLKSHLPGDKPIEITTSRYISRNSNFNFGRTSIDGQIVHHTDDDITPIRTFTTVGGNHGYTSISTVTDSNHNKTKSDLGSVWSDGATEYTLLQINGNDLVFGCPYNVQSNGHIESTRRKPVANLTHVRNGTNTQSISTSNETGGQLYPSVNKIKVDYILDGKLIEKDGEYLGDKLIIKEEYNIMDYKDIIDKAQSNVGTPYHELEIEGVTRMTNTYTFTKGLKNSTSHGIQALKTVNFMRSGFLQSARMGLSGHNLVRYVPNLKPVGGFDFGVGEDMTSYDTNLIIRKTDLKDDSVPVSYTTDWLVDSNGNKKYGFSMGYITDKTNSKKADRLANTDVMWDFRSTGKNYPVAIEGLTMEAGEYMNFQGFRHYLVPEEVGDAVNLSVVKDEADTYLYTHFENTATQDVFLKDEIGKKIEALQTDNLVNLNDTVDSSGVVLNSSGVSSGVFKIK